MGPSYKMSLAYARKALSLNFVNDKWKLSYYFIIILEPVRNKKRLEAHSNNVSIM